MYRIYIVEDDPALAEALKNAISKWNFEVHCASEFNNVTDEFARIDPHLVIMDMTLPFFNGCHWCRQIRKTSKVPIVFLSSAADNVNQVVAMNMGADDFIAKPVDTAVLIAKIQAVMRRCYEMAQPAQTLSHDGLVLDLGGLLASFDGKSTELTKNEMRILQTLLENKGSIVSRDTLMLKLWQVDSYVEENTLTVNVTRLRKKLAELGVSDMIKTRVGSGYIIET